MLCCLRTPQRTRLAKWRAYAGLTTATAQKFLPPKSFAPTTIPTDDYIGNPNHRPNHRHSVDSKARSGQNLTMLLR
jgi:hypothetical protein